MSCSTGSWSATGAWRTIRHLPVRSCRSVRFAMLVVLFFFFPCQLRCCAANWMHHRAHLGQVRRQRAPELSRAHLPRVDDDLKPAEPSFTLGHETGGAHRIVPNTQSQSGE